MNYEDLMIMTNALHRNNDEDNPYPKGIKVINGIIYFVTFGVRRNLIKYINFLRKRKGMRGRESLLFRVILTRC